MKSLQKYSTMWICKTLTATTCCHFQIFNTKSIGHSLFKQTCVHNLQIRQFAATSIFFRPTSHRSIGGTPQCNFSKLNGYMLNVQNSQPFYKFHVYCSSKLSQHTVLDLQVTQENQSYLSGKGDDIQCGNNGSSKFGTHDCSIEDSEEELEKELLWSVGPTPAATFTYAGYANESEIVKKLVDLGVDLSIVEKQAEIMPFILKLNYERDVLPSVNFLTENGLAPDKIGWYYTRNPHILRAEIMNLEKRLDYLRFKKFSNEDICRIINTNPFWLSFSVTRIDRRLGFFQNFFRLTGNQIRKLAVCGPKLITSNIDRIKDITFMVKEEMGFSGEELVQILLKRPRIWKEHPVSIRKRFDYLHNTVKFPHEYFVTCPELLLTRESRLKHRIGFLISLGKAQFDPEKPSFISFKMIYEGDDAQFATTVANSSVLQFNEYMKSL